VARDDRLPDRQVDLHPDEPALLLWLLIVGLDPGSWHQQAARVVGWAAGPAAA
jgi:hypothetical protein